MNLKAFIIEWGYSLIASANNLPLRVVIGNIVMNNSTAEMLGSEMVKASTHCCTFNEVMS